MPIPFSSGKQLSINQLSGVDINSVANDEVLKYNSTLGAWHNGESGGGGLDMTLNNLTVAQTTTVNELYFTNKRVLKTGFYIDAVANTNNQVIKTFNIAPITNDYTFLAVDIFFVIGNQTVNAAYGRGNAYKYHYFNTTNQVMGSNYSTVNNQGSITNIKFQMKKANWITANTFQLIINSNNGNDVSVSGTVELICSTSDITEV
tara:strand:+ start:390 stop:1001 length:612 start_codon:yes stop_codon:yes gene_type:complete